MKTLLVISVLMFSIGNGLSAAKQTLDTGTSLFAKLHAQIEALTSN